MLSPFQPKHALTPLAVASLLVCCACSTTRPIAPPASTGSVAMPPDDAAPTRTTADPFLWLEDIDSERALDWVRARNAETLEVFQKDARYDTLRERALEILNADDRIPYGSLRRGFVYNFWRDDTHVRGLWRRQPLRAYLASDDTWEVLLDVDALAEAEDENWVFKGARCAPPDFERCIVDLSRGGKDASVLREFDIPTRTFIDDGFVLPEAKSSASWVDKDTLIISMDYGPTSLTESGYPRTLKLWRRGTSFRDATTILEIPREEVLTYAWVNHTPEQRTILLGRRTDFFHGDLLLLDDDLTTTIKLPLPDDISARGLFGDQLLLIMRSAGTLGGKALPQGALVAVDLAPFKRPNPPTRADDLHVSVLVEPDDATAIRSVTITRGEVLVTLLRNVRSVVLRFDRDASGAWQQRALALPDTPGVASVFGSSAFEEDAFVVFENPTAPETLYHWQGTTQSLEATRSNPERFDASKLRVDQYTATSKDGTAVPYYVIAPKDAPRDGSMPTYLYGYGGFEVSILPSYRPLIGAMWLQRGGAYVIANIRGGGEFGPRWHQAALKANRQRAYDDFHAVAEDLIAKKITRADKLGIGGGSNGGLLVGVAFTQRPDLYQAVICSVPLLDMMRYHKLLAGASWVAEYGSPDIPEERTTLLSYSPYQNVDADTSYPRVFFTTSTADDRVHPGHARKMAAKMQAQGHPIFYYENIEGGHGGVANNTQLAMVSALRFIYMMRELGLD